MPARPVLHNSPTLPDAGLPRVGFPLWGPRRWCSCSEYQAGLKMALGASTGTGPGTAVQPRILTERSHGKCGKTPTARRKETPIPGWCGSGPDWQ